MRGGMRPFGDRHHRADTIERDRWVSPLLLRVASPLWVEAHRWASLPSVNQLGNTRRYLVEGSRGPLLPPFAPSGRVHPPNGPRFALLWWSGAPRGVGHTSPIPLRIVVFSSVPTALVAMMRVCDSGDENPDAATPAARRIDFDYLPSGPSPEGPRPGDSARGDAPSYIDLDKPLRSGQPLRFFPPQRYLGRDAEPPSVFLRPVWFPLRWLLRSHPSPSFSCWPRCGLSPLSVLHAT
eukprot:gb/GEZJ01004469.1/.p1 GENE.gb/GEZJ01004469.1/~~gb/GEZJ01004469.1/.p1  ORF type:complete len:237 (+),score=7.08 gb/GEZJ01004469.1/:195-905(+)